MHAEESTLACVLIQVLGSGWYISDRCSRVVLIAGSTLAIVLGEFREPLLRWVVAVGCPVRHERREGMALDASVGEDELAGSRAP